MRNTKQKVLIYNIIYNTYSHLTAQQVYEIARESIKNISLGTVYRILNEFCEDNKILRIKTNNNIDKFDRLDMKHCHFICDRCESVIDVFDIKIKDISEDLSKHQVNNANLIFNGICNDCKKKED